MNIIRELIEAIKDHTKAMNANTKVISQNNDIWDENKKKDPDPKRTSQPGGPGDSSDKVKTGDEDK